MCPLLSSPLLFAIYLIFSPRAYREYAAQVREEFGHVSSLAWCCGRAAVLDKLLARRSLFHLDLVLERRGSTAGAAAGASLARMEEAARDNLAGELNTLGPLGILYVRGMGAGRRLLELRVGGIGQGLGLAPAAAAAAHAAADDVRV